MRSLAGLAFAALAACGHHGSTTADAWSGPATLTISGHGRGLVVSQPAGISCGACSNPFPSQCPNPPLDGSQCSAVFDYGTPIKLVLTEQMIYFATVCSSTDDPNLRSCTFTLTHPMTVMVSGVEAVQ